MRISASYTVDDWKALTFSTELDWELAVDMFQDRLKTRYLDHIDVLISRKTSGFAVLTLDCALIETLQQFRTGVGSTPFKEVNRYFEDFLRERRSANTLTRRKQRSFTKKFVAGFYISPRQEALRESSVALCR